MSLQCAATNRDIEFGTPLYAATRSELPFFLGLSEEALAQIPVTERHSEPCSGGDGIDINKATSNGPTTVGSYSLSGFTLGDFLFSISQESLSRHFPSLEKRLAKEIAHLA